MSIKQIKQIKVQTKGVSIPMVIGLVLVLMIASVAANSLIIKTMRSSYRVEASNRAYLAAEGGIEDALYELSPHFSGYETKATRVNDYGGDLEWKSDWNIKSLSGEDSFNGKLYEKQKLTIGLYNDKGYSNNQVTTPLSKNVISNEVSTDTTITTLDVSGDFKITFTIPHKITTDNPNSFDIPKALTINNDNDDAVNEDGESMSTVCVTGKPVTNDADCDGKENEDGNEDPVIFWRITDGVGNVLTPKPGCLTGMGATPGDDDPEGSEICEKDFKQETVDIDGISTNVLTVKLDANAPYTMNGGNPISGFNQNGIETTIRDFLVNTNYSERKIGLNDISKLQIEFTVVAPLKQTNPVSLKKLPIPYLDYKIETSGVTNVPLPQFTITSDGWFNNFKQSIVTTVTPKTSVPLFDFTIIQQQ